jgi:hypothetical protein
VGEKEVGWMGRAGENKKIWPKAIFRVKTFSIFQTIFQFSNNFEFKSSLKFDDFYSHNKMKALHQY